MYIVCLKDNIAIATAICNNLEEMQPQLSVYDEFIEVDYEVFQNIPLPAKLDNGKWVKTDEYPNVEYPQAQEPTQATDEGNGSIYDELAAAYKEGVQEA
jgi:hypothetical protein